MRFIPALAILVASISAFLSLWWFLGTSDSSSDYQATSNRAANLPFIVGGNQVVFDRSLEQDGALALIGGEARRSNDKLSVDHAVEEPQIVACDACAAKSKEIVALKARLAREMERSNQLSSAALEAAFREDSPVGNVVRQDEFLQLDSKERKIFVDLMLRHFPIYLSPSETSYVADAVSGKGDQAARSNLVDASVRFIGAQRILDEVDKLGNLDQVESFDREYVEYLRGQ